MKYILFFCLLSLLLNGCRKTPQTPEKTATTKGKYFFDFDEAIYYVTDISTDELYKMAQSENNDNRLLRVVYGNTPKNISDTGFLSFIDSVGYTKKIISTDKIAALKEILKQKDCNEISSTSCTRFYRDIFVLKKKGKMTGVVKLCYSCGDVELIGAKGDTGCFGKNNELAQLKKIVK